MAVSAKRQSFLDNDTNLGVADFTKAAKGLLNGGSATQETSESAAAMADSAKGIGYVNSNDTIMEKTMALVRVTKDPTDFTSTAFSLGQSDMEVLLRDYVGNNPYAMKAFNVLGNSCKNLILGKIIAEEQRLAKRLGGVANKIASATAKYRRALEKVYNIASGNFIKIGNSSPCTFGAFADLTAKVAGKTMIDAAWSSVAEATFTTAIAERGYQIGAPNVFDTLSNALKDDIGKTIMATSLLVSLSKSGNIDGVKDVASNKHGKRGAKAAGNISKTSTKNYKKNSRQKTADLSDFWSLMSGTLNSIDSAWNKSTGAKGKTIASAKNLPADNADTLDVIRVGTTKQTVDLSDPTKASVSDDSFIYAAAKVKSESSAVKNDDALTTLQNEMGDSIELTSGTSAVFYGSSYA